MSRRKCTAVIASVNSSRQGLPCGRLALHTDGDGQPRCGYHEPEALARRIALIRYEPGRRNKR